VKGEKLRFERGCVPELIGREGASGVQRSMKEWGGGGGKRIKEE
jgi:hypothetical protein